MASALTNLVEVTRVWDDLHAAPAYFEQRLLVYRQVSNILAALVMGCIAAIQLQHGKDDQAHELYAIRCGPARGLGSKPSIRLMLNHLGRVAHAKGILPQFGHLQTFEYRYYSSQSKPRQPSINSVIGTTAHSIFNRFSTLIAQKPD